MSYSLGPSLPWHAKDCFNKYWYHYDVCFRWLHHHLDYDTYSKQNSKHFTAHQHGRKPESRLKQYKTRQHCYGKESHQSRETSENTNVAKQAELDGFQMEVSEDFLNFLAQSANHRLTRG